MITIKYPLHIEVKITNKCNLRCVHCASNSGTPSRSELTLKEISEVIKEAKENGAFAIGLTGGEPFLREDIFEIIDIVNKYGLETTITTNATTINRNTIEKIKNKVSLIRVSLDHSDPVKHDKFRNSPGSFNKTVKALKILQEYNEYFQTVILTVVSKYNIKELPQIIKWFEEENLKTVNFFLFVPAGRGKKLKKDMLLDKKAISSFCYFIEKEKKTNKNLNILTESPLLSIVRGGRESRVCPAAFTSCFVTEEGNVIPCPYFFSFDNYRDNIREKSIKEIWNNSYYFEILRQPNYLGDKCKKCEFRTSCFGGCRAGALDEFHTIKKPDPMCWL